MVGASRAKPGSLGDGDEDGGKTEQVIPSIAFVTEEKVSRRVARATLLTGNVVVIVVVNWEIMAGAGGGFWSQRSSLAQHCSRFDWGNEIDFGIARMGKLGAVLKGLRGI